jgi:hypothetical protein
MLVKYAFLLSILSQAINHAVKHKLGRSSIQRKTTLFLLHVSENPAYVHCYNRIVCLPVIPGEGAVSFMTAWIFPIPSPEAEGKISTNPSFMERFPHISGNISVFTFT